MYFRRIANVYLRRTFHISPVTRRAFQLRPGSLRSSVKTTGTGGGVSSHPDVTIWLSLFFFVFLFFKPRIDVVVLFISIRLLERGSNHEWSKNVSPSIVFYFFLRKWKEFLYIYREHQNNECILTSWRLDMTGVWNYQRHQLSYIKR